MLPADLGAGVVEQADFADPHVTDAHAGFAEIHEPNVDIIGIDLERGAGRIVLCLERKRRPGDDECGERTKSTSDGERHESIPIRLS